jgi:pimeloyl-ACP methyl ester carboxylesterase
VLGLLLCFGALGYPANAAPARPGSETRSGFFATSDGVRLHYVEAGQSKAIVFVPGWSMIWEKQVAHFAEHYHVVALDPRDQGESDKVLLKGMSREKCSPSAQCRSFFLGIQPN